MPPMYLYLGYVMAMLYWYTKISFIILENVTQHLEIYRLGDVHQFFLIVLRVLTIFLFHYESKRFS